jgi:hypothetical protein
VLAVRHQSPERADDLGCRQCPREESDLRTRFRHPTPLPCQAAGEDAQIRWRRHGSRLATTKAMAAPSRREADSVSSTSLAASSSLRPSSRDRISALRSWRRRSSPRRRAPGTPRPLGTRRGSIPRPWAPGGGTGRSPRWRSSARWPSCSPAPSLVPLTPFQSNTGSKERLTPGRTLVLRTMSWPQPAQERKDPIPSGVRSASAVGPHGPGHLHHRTGATPSPAGRPGLHRSMDRW